MSAPIARNGSYGGSSDPAQAPASRPAAPPSVQTTSPRHRLAALREQTARLERELARLPSPFLPTRSTTPGAPAQAAADEEVRAPSAVRVEHAPKFDAGDQVWRCTACGWEVVCGRCEACEVAYEVTLEMGTRDEELIDVTRDEYTYSPIDAPGPLLNREEEIDFLRSFGFSDASIERYQVEYDPVHRVIVATPDKALRDRHVPHGWQPLTPEQPGDAVAEDLQKECSRWRVHLPLSRSSSPPEQAGSTDFLDGFLDAELLDFNGGWILTTNAWITLEVGQGDYLTRPLREGEQVWTKETSAELVSFDDEMQIRRPLYQPVSMDLFACGCELDQHEGWDECPIEAEERHEEHERLRGKRKWLESSEEETDDEMEEEELREEGHGSCRCCKYSDRFL